MNKNMAQERLTSSLITLTADFGDRFAQAQVELVVHSINPDAKLVVISNEVLDLIIKYCGGKYVS